jgi:hypothetical protein
MLRGQSFSEALLICTLLAIATDAVGHLPFPVLLLTHPYFPSPAFSFKEKPKEYQMWKAHLQKNACPFNTKGLMRLQVVFCLSGS